jgi:hypothetical protein
VHRAFLLCVWCVACFDLRPHTENPSYNTPDAEKTPHIVEDTHNVLRPEVRSYALEGFCSVTDIAMDRDGHLFLTGFLKGKIGFRDQKTLQSALGSGYVLKTDEEGRMLWSAMPSDERAPWVPLSVAVQSKGDVLIGGYYERSSPCDGDGSMLQSTVPDAVLMQWNAQGEKRACLTAHRDGFNTVLHVGVDAHNTWVAAGGLGQDALWLLNASMVFLPSNPLKSALLSAQVLSLNTDVGLLEALETQQGLARRVFVKTDASFNVVWKTFLPEEGGVVRDVVSGYDALKGVYDVAVTIQYPKRIERFAVALYALDMRAGTWSVVFSKPFSAGDVLWHLVAEKDGLWMVWLKPHEGSRKAFLEHRTLQGDVKKTYVVASKTGKDVLHTQMLTFPEGGFLWVGVCEEGCVVSEEGVWEQPVQGLWMFKGP